MFNVTKYNRIIRGHYILTNICQKVIIKVMNDCEQISFYEKHGAVLS